MRIVYCLQALSRSGGIERVVTTKANYLARQGHEVHIVTTDQRDEASAFPLEPSIRLHDLGLNYELDNSLGRWGRLRALRQKAGQHLEALRRLFAELRPDVAISTGFQERELLPRVGDRSKKICELHTSKYAYVRMYPEEQRLHRLYGHYRVWQLERTARRYDRFVILTEEELPQWRGLRNVLTIPNPRPFASAERADMSRHQVMAVGRLEYVKNFATLLDVWAMIPREDFPDWQLNIYGSGPYHSRLQAQIERLGIGDRCVLQGDTPEIRQRYMEHSIYVMCSHFEGLPMVLLEAQAVGLPIVSYAFTSGPRDIVTDGVDGILTPAGEPEALAAALRRLMADEELRQRMSQAAHRASERFALERIMARWEQLFSELMAEA